MEVEEEASSGGGEEDSYSFAVIGGGIAGVSCVEQILEFDQEARILLVSASPVVKEASEITRLSKTLEDFVIVEKSLKSFKDVHQSVRVVNGEVAEILPEAHTLITKDGQRFVYKKLCLCNGASPRVVFPGWEHVVGIRDTESVAELASKIANARKVLILGNGGIATEFVHEVSGVEIVWAIKDKSICAHFVDPGAAEFFLQSKVNEGVEGRDPGQIDGEVQQPLSKRRKYTISSVTPSQGGHGSALGPDWHQGVNLQGKSLGKNIKILYETECTQVREKQDSDSESWPVYGVLTNGQVVGCDLVISATGVVPNVKVAQGLEHDPEKGIFVDSSMQSSAKDVFAAGDVCYPKWEWSKHWFQMRLWTQARQMGLYAGKSMYFSLQNELNPESPENVDLDFCFECFSHVTKFFGFKVVLLGLYNGQGLDKTKMHYLIRCTKNLEYIKVVLEDWRMQGAILIGDTGLEETFENLILNQVHLEFLGEELLNPDVDIEDYFD